MLNINHTEFAKKRLDLIVRLSTMKFKHALTANNSFIVSSKITKGELPFQWAHKQEIEQLTS
jgi:hypothetical protein